MKNDFRYEIKFVANETNYSIFNEWFFSQSDFFKSYPERQINSLYFDDNDFTSVKDNLSGIANRKKIRLRWYGNNTQNKNNPILEIKNKNGRLGSKEHINIPSLQNNIYECKIKKIKEIIFDKSALNDYLSNKDYLPSLIVSYRRKYFENNENIRITLDSDISFSEPLFNKKITNHEKLYFNKRIIELKFSMDKKISASRLIKDLDLVPTRHSKYLTGLAMFGKVNYL